MGLACGKTAFTALLLCGLSAGFAIGWPSVFCTGFAVGLSTGLGRMRGLWLGPGLGIALGATVLVLLGLGTLLCRGLGAALAGATRLNGSSGSPPTCAWLLALNRAAASKLAALTVTSERKCFNMGLLQTSRSAQDGGFVGFFPSELGLFAAEVTVSRCLGVNRAQQIQHLNDAFRTQIKVRFHQFGQLVI